MNVIVLIHKSGDLPTRMLQIPSRKRLCMYRIIMFCYNSSQDIYVYPYLTSWVKDFFNGHKLFIIERVKLLKSFSTSHPVVLLVYYLSVMLITIFFIHPLVLVLSFLSSFSLMLLVKNKQQLFRELRLYSILFLIIVLTNPLFVHEGETTLFEFIKIPVTLEAILYGVFIAMMLISIINWSRLFSDMITTDKIVYLFGRIFPKMSLILTMSLRFVPLFIKRIKKISMTQETFQGCTGNGIKNKVLHGIQTFHIIITWSLESSVIQADAMKARGYGLKDRSNYSIFRWSLRDTFIITISLSLTIIILYFNYIGELAFHYYPSFQYKALMNINLPLLFTIIGLMLLPSMFEIKEQIKWKYLQSKM